MAMKNLLITGVLLMLLGSSSGIGQQKLLIIAADDFIEAVRPLQRFKEASARRCVLMSLTDVYNLSFPGDEAEQVKRCIAFYEQIDGIEHVLLVGDVDRFPVRWRWWGLPGQEGWSVSELYYADLYEDGTKTFDDWDSNNNGLYGEIEFTPDGTINNDHIDFLPDVSVGRIPASTEAEVTAYVDKVIAYEIKTRPSDPWFKKAGLYTGSWFSNANAVKDGIGSALTSKGVTLIKRYWDWQNDQAPAGVPGTIISDLNSGIGFANYLGHGNTASWACLGLNSNQLQNLNNAHRLPVVFSGACDTGMFARMAPFDLYRDIAGQGHCGTDQGELLPPGPYPHTNVPRPACVQDGQMACNNSTYTFDRPCVAETFIFGNPTGSTGAIAYLGERTGGQATIVDLDRKFFEAYKQGRDILGYMWTYMLEQYYAQHKLANSHTWWRDPSQWRVGHTFDEPQKLVLFGDPSLVVGGAFTRTVSGPVSDLFFPFFLSYSRHRIVGDVTVAAGEALTADQGVSILFDSGRKVTAVDSRAGFGFHVNGEPHAPVYLLAPVPPPCSENVVRGVKVRGQMRLRNGGAIKLY